MGVRTGEILFVKSVKCGIPNRDPLRDSDARRLFGEDDGRISLSDVSVKRDVRDYVLDRFPSGDGNNFIFVQKKFNPEGTALLGREGLAQEILRQVRPAPSTSPPEAPELKPAKKSAKAREAGAADDEKSLMAAAFDMRVFGAVYSVQKRSFHQTGPVQFSWAHSLHPVETKYTQGTVCMPSSEEKAAGASKDADKKDAEKKGKTQGTIWTQYQLPFAVFALPGVVNANIAGRTGMTQRDMDQLLAGLWRGTLNRQARGRGIQQPLLLLHVEYTDPFFRIGYLEEGIALDPGRNDAGRQRWLNRDGAAPTDLADVTLDVTGLAERLRANADRIARARLWRDPLFRLRGDLAVEPGVWPEGV